MVSRAPLVLEVWRGQQMVQRAEYNEPSITLGSGQSAMLRVDSPALSELHAVVNVEDDGSILVLDLGGEGGVVVGSEKVANAALRPGDTFQIGDLTFRVAHAEVAEDVATEQHTSPAASPYTPHEVAPHERIDHATEGSLLHEKEEHDAEDVVSFVMRPSAREPAAGDKPRPVLEVHHMWGNMLLDTRQFSLSDGRDVTLGTRTGHRWSFLGVDMGFVPAPLGFVLPMFAPMWSDVSSEYRTDFFVPRANLPEDRDWTLFSRDADDRYVAKIPSGWGGFAEIGGQKMTFPELAAAGKATQAGDGGFEVPVADDMRLMVEGGGSVFMAQNANAARRIIVRSGDSVDYAFMGLMAAGAVLFFGVVVTYLLVGDIDTSHDTVAIDDRFVELLLDKPEPEKKEKKGGNPDAGEGAKAKKEEGKVGKKESKIEKTKGNKIEVKKMELDRQIAENAGVLGAMADSDLNQVLGASGLSNSLTQGIGGLIGANGTQAGSGGLGARGSGIGGGGTAEGLGGLGTKGMGSGSSGYGKGGGDFGAKGEGGIAGVGGDPIILGALDRSLIDEVVKRHMNQIKYCYQRELTKNPALNGKIVIKFTIAKDGSVSQESTKTSSMKNSSVENCIVGRFMRMQFPEPKGGGIVIVSYPFLFSPG
ncbi:MAG: AgmX/PglI C-terminal domain-containing protein [Myxococcota bacterium]